MEKRGLLDLIKDYCLDEKLSFEKFSERMIESLMREYRSELGFIGYGDIKGEKHFNAYWLERKDGKVAAEPVRSKKKHMKRMFLLANRPMVINNFETSKYKTYLPKKHRKIKRLLFCPLKSNNGVSLIMLANKRTNYTKEALKAVLNFAVFYSAAAQKNFIKRKISRKKDRIRYYLDNINAIVLVLDKKADIKLINKFGAEFVGKKPHSIVGKNWIENFIPPENRTEIQKIFQTFKEKKGKDFAMHTNPVLKSGGKRKNVLWANHYLATGEGMEVFCIGRPVFGKGDYEEKIYHQKQKYENILNASLDIIYSVDEKGVIYYVNDAVKWYGYSPEQITGKKVTNLCHKDDVEKIRKTFKESFESGKIPERFNVRILDNKGNTVYMEQKSAFFYDDRLKKKLLINFMRDITRIEELESQIYHLSKMETLGNITGQIAHDFNNILGAIEGYLSVMFTYAEKNTQLYKDLIDMRKAVKQGSDFTKQLLFFGKKSAGVKEIISPDKALKEMKILLESFISGGAELKCKCRKSVPKIKVSASDFKRIILNLAVNAKDAIRSVQRKNGIIELNLEGISDGKVPNVPLRRNYSPKWLKLSVRDNGMGIKEEHRSRLFEPFFTTKSKGQGSGFGLAIVYAIVKNAGGQISVESVAGKGSEFRIYLPAAVENAGQEKPALLPETGFSENVKTILVIEDEENLRNSLKRGLEIAGFKILSADGEQEAMKVFRESGGKIDLVFSDVVLKDGDGFEICQTLKKEKPELRVILTSGYIEKAEEISKITDKNYQFIPKPYKTEDLIMMIKKLR